MDSERLAIGDHAQLNGNKIGRITPAGVITEFPVPSGVQGHGRVYFGERFLLGEGEVRQQRLNPVAIKFQNRLEF